MENSQFLYKRLYDDLLKRINAGQYPLGSRLPTEASLCKEFHVSSITIKKALGLLAEEGLVFRSPGRGTFVKAKGNSGIPAAVSNEAEKPIKKIGAVLEHVSTPFGLDMMYQMDREAEQAGFKLCIRFSYGDQKKEMDEIRFLVSQGVSGLIMMPSHGRHYNTDILRLVLQRFPIVLIDKRLEGIPVSSVRTDNYTAAARLVQNLAERGCRTISMITFRKNGTTSLMERQDGFYNQAKLLNLTIGEACELPFPCDPDLLADTPKKTVSNYIRAYLARSADSLDGIVCMEYGIVPPFLLAAKAVGIPVGAGKNGKLKVCCFDEDYLAPHGFFFTHVKQDETAIAKKVVSLLISQIREGAHPTEDYKIPAVFRQGSTT